MLKCSTYIESIRENYENLSGNQGKKSYGILG